MGNDSSKGSGKESKSGSRFHGGGTSTGYKPQVAILGSSAAYARFRACSCACVRVACVCACVCLCACVCAMYYAVAHK
jgi:hypothetical protein